MPYDAGLAERVRHVLSKHRDVSEKQMFGGIAFLVGGHMAVGIVKTELMVRVGAEAYEKLIRQPHAREMDFTGRSMRGMVYVGVAGVAEDEDHATWVERGTTNARSLPPK